MDPRVFISEEAGEAIERPSPGKRARVDEPGPARRKKGFRINARSLFLTYPKCDCPMGDAFERARDLFREQLEALVVGSELHKDGTPHLHIFVLLKTKGNFRDQAVFDALTGKHGNYQSCRNRANVLKYCVKDGKYVEWWAEEGMSADAYLESRRKKVSSKSVIAAKMIKEGKSLVEVNEQLPGFMLLNLQKVQRYQAFCSQQTQSTLWTLPMMAVGTRGEQTILSWIYSVTIPLERPPFPSGSHLWIHTIPGAGKTRLLNVLMMYFRVYVASNDETFYDDYAEGSVQILAFDEYKGSRTPQHLNALCDGTPMVLRTKGGQIRKVGTPRILVLSNFSIEGAYPNVAADLNRAIELNALKRRFIVAEVESLSSLVEGLGHQEVLDHTAK